MVNTSTAVMTVPRVLCLPEAPGLGAMPLLAGLEEADEVSLIRRPTGRVAGTLTNGESDAAIISLMDLHRAGQLLTVIPAGCVSCCQRSVTIRLFSRVPPEELGELAARARDESAAVLARLIWLHTYGQRLEVVPLSMSPSHVPPRAQAVLLADDASHLDPPGGFDWQCDLGSLWFEMTGLPLVRLVWAAGARPCTAGLYRLLLGARQLGQRRAEAIAARHGPPAGWPVDLAARYLAKDLRFDFSDEHREGIEEFFDLAERAGIIEGAGPLRYYRP